MIQEFLQKYKEAFGNTVPLPATFGYSQTLLAEIKKILRCIIKVCKGEPLALSIGNVLYSKGSLYITIVASIITTF